MKILTFDIEEWFHILDNESTKTKEEWKNYESRIHRNMDRIFEVLSENQVKATFFCLGWIAEKYPEVIKKIVGAGYEIGSHNHMHQLVYEQEQSEFERELEYSVKTLQDISGLPVKYFRAPGFSITENTKWAFEILNKHGIVVDSSVFPAQRAHGGFPSYKTPVPSIIQYNGISLKELPISYTTILGRPIIFSGGGYFRLISYSCIRRWSKKSEYVMSYLHPRDFDPGQPMIKDLPLSRKFKSYVGLKGAEKKLNKWLQDFEFVDIQTAVKQIDWDKVPIVKI
jgi:polysaccharide deacetylase family protein (PEP-CTERM system associated)